MWFKNKLREAGVKAMLNQLSCTVVFERPQDFNFVRKWQLACEGHIAHAVVMPNVTQEQLQLFITEYLESRKVHPPENPLPAYFDAEPFQDGN
eukprot:Pgem_evm1s8326